MTQSSIPTPPRISPALRRRLRWAPLGLAGALVLMAGGALASASAGLSEEEAEVVALVESREQSADEAEEAFYAAWDQVRTEASTTLTDRDQGDSRAAAGLLDSLAQGATAEQAAAEHGVDPALAATLAQSFAGRTGELEAFEAVVTAHGEGAGAEYSYLGLFESGGAHGALSFTTSAPGSIASASLVWAQGPAQRSS